MERSGFHIIRLPRVSSTQDLVRLQARAGAPSGTLVLADEQTSGRGRGGRDWASPAGMGLWMSLIHRSDRPAAEWPALTMVAAEAVCESFASHGLVPQAKWPNDVLLSRRKAAGVLGEVEDRVVLLGIGINVLQTREGFPSQLRERATSIRIEAEKVGLPIPERDAFLAQFLVCLREGLDRFERGGPADAVARIWERSALKGKMVRVALPGGEILSGRALGLGPVGELRLQVQGREERIPSGSILDVRAS